MAGEQFELGALLEISAGFRRRSGSIFRRTKVETGSSVAT